MNVPLWRSDTSVSPHEMKQAMTLLQPLRGSRFYQSSVSVVQAIAKREGSGKALKRARAIREEFDNLQLLRKVA